MVITLQFCSNVTKNKIDSSTNSSIILCLCRRTGCWDANEFSKWPGMNGFRWTDLGNLVYSFSCAWLVAQSCMVLIEPKLPILIYLCGPAKLRTKVWLNKQLLAVPSVSYYVILLLSFISTLQPNKQLDSIPSIVLSNQSLNVSLRFIIFNLRQLDIYNNVPLHSSYV